MEVLFTQYAAAFDAFDASAIASLYRLPCAICDGDGVQTYQDLQDLTEKFKTNCIAMRDFGYQLAEFKILQQQSLGPDKTTVTIAWRINTLNSNIDFRTLYICHYVSEEWKIFSANVYEGSF